jgi:hypothetical protein
VRRAGAPLPSQIGRPLAGAVRALLERATVASMPAARPATDPEPVAVVAGSLGSWSDDEVDG